MYVDGVASPTAGDLSSIDPAALEGVEVYPRPALAPAEFRRVQAGTSVRSGRFWRMTNEIPFLIAIVMVLSVTTEWTFG